MQTTTSSYERLRSQVEFPEAWKPHAGSPTTLIGLVTAETEIPFKDVNGIEKRQTAFVVRDESPDAEGKEWTIATFHSVLRNELLEHAERGRLRVGDFVAVHYQGLRENATGTEYHNYRVAVERPTADVPSGEPAGDDAPAADGDSDIPFA